MKARTPYTQTIALTVTQACSNHSEIRYIHWTESQAQTQEHAAKTSSQKSKGKGAKGGTHCSKCGRTCSNPVSFQIGLQQTIPPPAHPQC